METTFGYIALTFIFCVNELTKPIHTTALQTPGKDTDDCKPVVLAGKDVPQHTTYRIDGKRSYGKPGNGSHLVHRRHCTIGTGIYRSPFPKQPRDCNDIRVAGANASRVYSIDPEGTGRPFNVYCDMETDGGGWTMLQRRMDGSVNFIKYWSAYKNGFGSISSEHWLGNEKIHRLTSQNTYKLRVDLADFYGNTAYALYSLFKVHNETLNYRLQIGAYIQGTAGDGLRNHNGQPFTTLDRNNAVQKGCSRYYRVGWWFRACILSNLNGIYKNGTIRDDFITGLVWSSWKSPKYSLKTTEMKILPVTMND